MHDAGPSDSQHQLHAALALLHAHHRGTLLADGTPAPVRFILARHRPKIIATVHPTTLDADELVLFIPEETLDATQLLLDVDPIATAIDHGIAAEHDRFLAYHSRPEASEWIAADIDACRSCGEVFDRDELEHAMTTAADLLADEHRLLREINGELRMCVSLATRAGLRDVEHAVVVGVDPWGADVRAGTHLRRVDFLAPVHDADAALTALHALAGDDA